MIAAIYARKSTEQNGADADAKSVARQIENAKAFAAAKGWTIAEAYAYADDAVSGADTRKLVNRQRLLDAIRTGPPFRVLIMRDASRFSRRDGDEAFGELKAIANAGVQIWFYQDGQPFKFGTFGDNIAGYVNAEMNAEFRRAISRWTTEAMRRKALAGHVTGGRVFGYDNVRVDGHVERRINDTEAAIVRRIFEGAAAGNGQKRIAIDLNTEGSPAPRSQQGRPCAWAQSSVHEVLFRDLYRGEIVWNRTRKRNQDGEKSVTPRPSSEWLRMPAPALRIVPEELWQAAHARIAKARAEYRDATKGLRGGRRQLESKYLLPGFARCSCCNGGLFVSCCNHGSPGHRRRVFAYGCTSHHNKGRVVCPNGLKAPVEALDAVVLESIGKLITPDLAEDIVGRVRELLEEPHQDERRERLVSELAAAELKVEKYAEAIATAGNVPAVARRLREADERRQELARSIEELGAVPLRARVDWRAAERQAREKMAAWRELLHRQVAAGWVSEARKVLRQLLREGPIRFEPFEEPGRRGYRFRGALSIGEMLDGIVQWQMASPPGSGLPLAIIPFSGELEVRRRAA